MGLFDFLKRKKRDGEYAPEEAPAAPISIDDADLSAFDPPETRYTQEDKDFLASQDAVGGSVRATEAAIANADGEAKSEADPETGNDSAQC